MTSRARIAIVPALLALALGAPVPASAASRLDRPGTIGILAYGSYGTVTGGSRYGLDFGDGLGFGVGIRYTLARRLALGLYFQNQRYDSVTDPSDGIDYLSVTHVMGELYYYRDRETSASQYFVVGLGFHRPEIHYQQEDLVGFPSENLALMAGLGAEMFIRETWGLDLSARAIAYHGDGVTDQEREDSPELLGGSWSVGIYGQVGVMLYILR